MRNIYDNSEFFAAYAEMGRSIMGMPGMCNEMRRPMMLLVKVKKV